MVYKYYASGSPYSGLLPNDSFKSNFSALLNYQFSNATTYYIIQEESALASGSFVDVGARILSAVDAQTGEKLGDDYKKLIFGNLSHDIRVGHLFYFSDNYWIATFSEAIQSFTPSCTQGYALPN